MNAIFLFNIFYFFRRGQHKQQSNFFHPPFLKTYSKRRTEKLTF